MSRCPVRVDSNQPEQQAGHDEFPTGQPKVRVADMQAQFFAGCVKVEEDQASITVGFADHQFATKSYLTLQRAVDCTDSDRRLKLDDIYAERDDQRWSGYGGIASCTLQPGLFRIEFNDLGVRQMEGLRSTEISFDIAADQLESLRAGLRRCFEDSEKFIDHVK